MLQNLLVFSNVKILGRWSCVIILAVDAVKKIAAVDEMVKRAEIVDRAEVVETCALMANSSVKILV